MLQYDVIIVGGGPAGSSCAARLARAGMEALVVDSALFPRDKPCAGWITLQVLERLELDPQQYARHGLIQPVSGFRVSLLGGRPLQLDYPQPVSHAIRRCEFDTYLLARSGARVRSGCEVRSIERRGGRWVINGEWEAPVLVGAGGHFCPVAKHLGAKAAEEGAVAAQEAEFELPPEQAARCPLPPGCVDLCFAPDLEGYGWCVRKNGWLNVGFGTLRHRALKPLLERYLGQLRRAGILPEGCRPSLRGHAYLLQAVSRRPLYGEGVLLAGDAAGLAFSSSGEGILPAVVSGQLAAEAVLAAGLKPERLDGAAYARALEASLGPRGAGRKPAAWWERLAARFAFRSPGFVRREVVEKRFLRRNFSE